MSEEWRQRLLAAIAAYIDVIDEPLALASDVNKSWDDVNSVIAEAMVYLEVASTGSGEAGTAIRVDPWPLEDGQVGIVFVNGRKRVFDSRTGDEVVR